MQTASIPEQSGPLRQPIVHRNDYTALPVPPLGGWEPSLSVSVVVPAHGGSEKLALVLAS
ncbi:glycosyltransferase family 2 protein, partial [Nocardiopsis alba]